MRLTHSVDSLRLAEEIQNAAAKLDDPVEVLIQVNTSGEKSKNGVAPPAAKHLVDQINTMMVVRPRGLMCMAPLTDDVDAIRSSFTRCRELFEDINCSPVGGERFNILSMGMSQDFEIAIASDRSEAKSRRTALEGPLGQRLIVIEHLVSEDGVPGTYVFAVAADTAELVSTVEEFNLTLIWSLRETVGKVHDRDKLSSPSHGPPRIQPVNSRSGHRGPPETFQ